MGRREIQLGENDAEILKALLKTGNHLEQEELERASKLSKLLQMELKRRIR